MKVVIRHDVNTCVECPHLKPSMDGSYCKLLPLEKCYVLSTGGRTGISTDCLIKTRTRRK